MLLLVDYLEEGEDVDSLVSSLQALASDLSSLDISSWKELSTRPFAPLRLIATAVAQHDCSGAKRAAAVAARAGEAVGALEDSRRHLHTLCEPEALAVDVAVKYAAVDTFLTESNELVERVQSFDATVDEAARDKSDSLLFVQARLADMQQTHSALQDETAGLSRQLRDSSETLQRAKTEIEQTLSGELRAAHQQNEEHSSELKILLAEKEQLKLQLEALQIRAKEAQERQRAAAQRIADHQLVRHLFFSFVSTQSLLIVGFAGHFVGACRHSFVYLSRHFVSQSFRSWSCGELICAG